MWSSELWHGVVGQVSCKRAVCYAFFLLFWSSYPFQSLLSPLLHLSPSLIYIFMTLTKSILHGTFSFRPSSVQPATFPTCLILTLKMVAVYPSETLVFACHATQCHDEDNHNFGFIFCLSNCKNVHPVS